MKNSTIILLCFLLYSLLMALNSKIYIFSFLPVILLAIYQRNIFFKAVKRLAFLNLFLVLIVLSAFINGDFQRGIMIFIRSNLIVFFGILLFYKIDANKVATGFKTLGFGNKFSTLIFISIVFIMYLKDEIKKFKNILKIRNFSPKTNLFTYKTYGNLIALLFINVSLKAVKLEKTMIIRNFNENLLVNRGNFAMNKKELFLLFLVVFLGFFICGNFEFGVLI